MPHDTRRPRDGKDPPAHLRLVHPSPPTSKPKRRRTPHQALVFTAAEQRMLRAAIHNARARWGTWKALAAALSCCPTVLSRAARGRLAVSAAVVLRLCFALRCAPQALIEGLRAVERGSP